MGYVYVCLDIYVCDTLAKLKILKELWPPSEFDSETTGG